MKKKVLSMVIILAIANLTFAQEAGYMKGFVVTNANDTIHGLIKRISTVPTRILPDIKFKKDENSDDVTYAAADIAAYQRNGQQYVSRTFPSDGGTPEKVFVEVVVDGYLSYYEFWVTGFGTGNNTLYQFLQRRGDDKLFTVSSTIGNAINIGASAKFRKSVVEYLADEPTLCDKITAEEYGVGKADDIARAYNLLKFRIEDSKGKGPKGTIMFYVKGTKKEKALILKLNDTEEREIAANKVYAFKIPTDAKTKICFGTASEQSCDIFSAIPYHAMPEYYELIVSGGKEKFDIQKRYTKEAQKDIAEMKGK